MSRRVGESASARTGSAPREPGGPRKPRGSSVRSRPGANGPPPSPVPLRGVGNLALQGSNPRVLTAGLHQGGVRALLHDGAILQYHNAIGAPDGGEPVGD